MEVKLSALVIIVILIVLIERSDTEGSSLSTEEPIIIETNDGAKQCTTKLRTCKMKLPEGSLIGKQGDRGEKGEKGSPGLNGIEGNRGEKGNRGDKGDRGFEGSPGLNGTHGNHGEKGNKGDRGFQGLIGLPGSKGMKGDPGQKGDQGLPGTIGETGKEGSKGEPGIKGEGGDMGSPGLNGTHGHHGEKGNQGDRGFQGPIGLPGSKGMKGDPGQKGDQGLPGPIGETGKEGSKGEPGIKGERGDMGSPGLSGFDGGRGEKGNSGDKGDRGSDGVTGPPGSKGMKGDRGEKGEIGLQGLTGDPGSPGIKGNAGIKGEIGETGPSTPGPIGPPGLPGTPGVCACEPAAPLEDYGIEGETTEFGTEFKPAAVACKYGPKDIESGKVYYFYTGEPFKAYCNTTANMATCIVPEKLSLDAVIDKSINYKDVENPFWLTTRGVDIKDIYGLTTSHIKWLQKQSVSVTMTLRYHCKNSIPFPRKDPKIDPSKAMKMLTWSELLIGPYPSETTPFFYSIPTESDECQDSDKFKSEWRHSDIILRSSNVNRLPIHDFYITDIRNEDQSLYIELIELCFA